MTFRRLVATGASIIVFTVGCGVEPAPDAASTAGADAAPTTAPGPTPVGDSIREVRAEVDTAAATTITAPTTTSSTVAAARRPVLSDEVLSSGLVGAVAKPEYLLKRAAEPVQDPVAVIVAPQLSQSGQQPSETPPPAVASPPTSAALTVTTTTTPPPVVTTPPAASTETTGEVPASTIAPPPPAPVANVDTGGADQFVNVINGLRAEVGVGSLTRAGDLDARALAWAQHMAETSDLGHSGNVSALVAGGWSTAGENVGYGPSVDAVFAGLLASSGHYTNMVNPSFTTVGVGVAVDGSGVVWTAHLFAG